ncbi:MAG: 30S ribosomal protein S13 [Candidatus Aenigmarchaeota archaeon ex4484_224]|nr:MAG: 30S ribosomal protein S13 [Candidatus Aenigmarchaeota archaeon ex4484_224]
MSKQKTEEKTVIRLIDTDLDGTLPVIRAIRAIKGIGFTMSKAIVYAAKLNPNKKLMELSEEELKRLEDCILNPKKYRIPSYLLNRRRDPFEGKDYHLVGQDVEIKMKEDIKREIALGTYRGWRHKLGQPVRGQKTRSHFRTGRTVGVVRKKEGK